MEGLALAGSPNGRPSPVPPSALLPPNSYRCSEPPAGRKFPACFATCSGDFTRNAKGARSLDKSVKTTSRAPSKPGGHRMTSRKADVESRGAKGKRNPSDSDSFCWRMFEVKVPYELDLGKDDFTVSGALRDAVAGRLNCNTDHLSPAAIRIVRKSLDARKVGKKTDQGPTFVYIVDIAKEEMENLISMSKSKRSSLRIKEVPNRLERYFFESTISNSNFLTPDSPLRLNNPTSQSNGFDAPKLTTDSNSHSVLASSLSFSKKDEQSNSTTQSLPHSPSNATETYSPNESSLEANARNSTATDSAKEASFTSYSSSTTMSSAPSITQMQPNLSQPDLMNAGRKGEKQEIKKRKNKIVVIGSGPAGLFCSLVLAENGNEVVLIERGEGVETRGKDIGSFIVKRNLNPNSNFCYGEGGAGTWSDGKLKTRIGKNSETVQMILSALVNFGASEKILYDGKPHLGTDKLVFILKNFRKYLLSLGVDIKFGKIMKDLTIRDGKVIGIKVGSTIRESRRTHSSSNLTDTINDTDDTMFCDAVVLATGHSARDVYEVLYHHDVKMSVKDFAVGFRIEHPQELIDKLRYGKWASEVQRGKGNLAVADYSLAIDFDKVWDDRNFVYDENRRGCYSFCMCPGGQIVSTSTNEWETCINGMSFSKRSSIFANSALVCTVGARDFSFLDEDYGPLAGIAFQRAIEREAALRGGGKFVVPVQRVDDFMNGKFSDGSLPSSSYRLGTRSSRLDQIYPYFITQAIKESLNVFDKELPGFISNQGLLHGVETRTSSPVRVDRHPDTFESTSTRQLYPIGEGAGYAGGIISAAVDGMLAGFSLVKAFSDRPLEQQK